MCRAEKVPPSSLNHQLFNNLFNILVKPDSSPKKHTCTTCPTPFNNITKCLTCSENEEQLFWKIVYYKVKKRHEAKTKGNEKQHEQLVGV